MNRAVALKVIAQNPIAALKAPRNLDSKPHRFYETDELLALYAACRVQVNNGEGPQPDPMRAFVWKLYANTGMRRMEGLHLLRKWVSTDIWCAPVCHCAPCNCMLGTPTSRLLKGTPTSRQGGHPPKF